MQGMAGEVLLLGTYLGSGVWGSDDSVEALQRGMLHVV